MAVGDGRGSVCGGGKGAGGVNPTFYHHFVLLALHNGRAFTPPPPPPPPFLVVVLCVLAFKIFSFSELPIITSHHCDQPPDDLTAHVYETDTWLAANSYLTKNIVQQKTISLLSGKRRPQTEAVIFLDG